MPHTDPVRLQHEPLPQQTNGLELGLASRGLLSYHYNKLDSNEIRLATILPGEQGSPLRLQIVKLLLHPVDPHSTSQPVYLDQMQSSLPRNWAAHETLESRVLFISSQDEEGRFRTSWKHPNAEDRQLTCKDQNERSIQSRYSYEALSYVWGSESDIEPVIIEDTSAPRTQLRIRRSLADALRHLRTLTSSRTVWIDALCINQNDLGERSKQVLRMRDIYQQARRVIIWLGCSDDGSDEAMSTLKYLGRQLEFTRQGQGQVFPSPGCEYPDWYYSATQLPYNDRIWASLHRLFMRPWFSRLWVIQEAQLASQDSIVQCGDYEVPWLVFRRAVICLKAKSDGPSSSLRSQLRYAGASANILLHFTLDQLLNSTCSRDVSDPRDKIYGMMSIAPQSFAFKIRPDYSLGVREVYKNTFLRYTEQYKRLTLLKYCGKLHQSWPTWIPDWTHNLDAKSDNWGFEASGVSMANATIEGDLLNVAGVRFSAVAKTDKQEIASMADIVTYLKQIDSGNSPYLGGGYLLDAYLWSLAFGSLHDRLPGRASWKPTSSEWKERLVQYQEEGQLSTSNRTFGRFENRVITQVNCRSILVLEGGFVGLGPRDTRTGDWICVILGCELPLVVRPAPEDRFTVVGQCYIHGIMQGEALLGPLPTPWSVKVKLEGDVKYRPRYFNTETNLEVKEDPRLTAIPVAPEWEQIRHPWTRDDPLNVVIYRNHSTGEEINCDPRMLPDALTARGVKVETISLI
ncbi:heterokaryon incompatibility protein-domain-containing protein [Xylariaceae sp. FL1651]|nr:heterokaryon incompatibility protein-domain-containing protein [Xylariaceae sp. FL1651]